jgi:hemoglobin/transferrin/lactoferrin receptor protein
VAGRSGAWSGLLAYTRRDGQETGTQGDVDLPDSRRTVANPQDIESNSVLGKAVFAPNDRHRFRLTVDHFDREVVTEVLSGRAPPPLAASAVVDLDARDTTDRDRVALDHRYSGAGGLIDQAQWTVYWQRSETREFTDEDRFTAADRIRDNTFDTEVFGFSGQGESSFTAMNVPHRLVWGLDASRTRQEGLRDGTVPPMGETFPTRAFPNTDYTLVGAFVQDEITLIGGRLKLYPALRFDWYELKPKRDALFTGLAAESSDERLSPKLGAVYWSDGGWGLFANYADGFRAPSPMQVNNAFSNPIFGYTSIPNPDLEPETSRTFEAGVRFRDLTFAGGTWQAQAAAFTGRYENFIEQVALTPPLPTLCGGFALCYQYVNLGEVEISGFEARLDGRWDSGFGLTAALGLAEGDVTSGVTDTPLDSVDPLKVVIGASYRQPAGRWGGQAIVTWADRKDVGDVGGGCSPGLTPADCYRPDGFTLLDVTAWWRVTDRATLRVGAFNLTDETYAWWSDVRGLSAASTVLDAYTQPGRNVSVSLTYSF